MSDLRDIGQPEEWMSRAACTEVDPDIFFPTKGGSLADARKVCGSCDVRIRCLRYALENEIEHGVFAGTSSRQRAGLLERRAA